MQSEPRKRPRTELSDNLKTNLNEDERLQIKMIEELLLNQGFSDYDDEFDDLDSAEMIRLEQEATQKYVEGSVTAERRQIGEIVTDSVHNDDSTEMIPDRESELADQTELADLIPSPQTQAHTQAHSESLYHLKQKLASLEQKEAELEKSLFDKIGECEFARSKINQLQVDNDRLKKSVNTIERESIKDSLERRKELEESVQELKTQISFKDHEIKTLQNFADNFNDSQQQVYGTPLSRQVGVVRNVVQAKAGTRHGTSQEQVSEIVPVTKIDTSTATEQPEINQFRKPYDILQEIMTELEVLPTNYSKHYELLKLILRKADFSVLVNSIFPYRDEEYLLQVFGCIIVSGIPQEVGVIFNLEIFNFLVAEYSHGLTIRKLNIHISRWILDLSLECPPSSRVRYVPSIDSSLAFIASPELIPFLQHSSNNPSLPHEPILNLLQTICILLTDEFLSTRLKSPELFKTLSLFMPLHHKLIQNAIIGIYFTLNVNEISLEILRTLIKSFHYVTKSSLVLDIKSDVVTRYLLNNYIDILYELFTGRDEDVQLDLGLFSFMVVSLSRCLKLGFVEKGLVTKCKQLLDLFE